MKKPFHNDKAHTVYLGSVSIPANETRLVEACFVPAPVIQDDSEPEPDPVRELLELTVPQIEDAVLNPDAPMDPAILDAALAVEEGANKPRKGVVRALNEALLAAASASADDDEDPGDGNG